MYGKESFISFSVILTMYYDDKPSKIIRTYYKVIDCKFNSPEAPAPYVLRYRLYRWLRGRKGAYLYVFKKKKDALAYAKRVGGLVFACYVKDAHPALEVDSTDPAVIKTFWKAFSRYMRRRHVFDHDKFRQFLKEIKLDLPLKVDDKSLLARSVRTYRILQQ